MSKREQSLLTLLIFVALCAGLLIGYRQFYEPTYRKTKQKLESAERQKEEAGSIIETAELIKEEVDWLESYEPDPTTQQSAQSSLQADCEKNAKGSSLEIKKQTLLSSVQTEGAYYHRARMDMLVSGSEVNFYKWVSIMDDPTKFRRVTYLRLNPLRDDDTQIEARVVIEKWYVPESLTEL